MIEIIVGPGHHDRALIAALEQNNYKTRAFYYYPHFYAISNQENIAVNNWSYNLVSKISYGIKRRLETYLDYHWPMDHLFVYYDHLVSARLNTKNKILIGWPQVSLKSFKKSKRNGGTCILEHPMIHVNEWMQVMKDAYEKLPGIKSKHGLFTNNMQSRMLEEYEQADKINVLSTYAYNTFIKYGVPQHKLNITNLSIDVNKFIIKKENYPQEKFIFLFVGRLEILKGVHLLIKAFNDLKLAGAELWLVGEKRREIESFLEGENVKYLGIKTRQELVNVYNEVNCLVLPSLQESYGLVLLEALATGVPVIATSNSGGEDILAKIKGGLVFKAGDVELLKEVMFNMYNNFSFDKKALREQVINNFSTDHYKQQIKKLISSAESLS